MRHDPSDHIITIHAPTWVAWWMRKKWRLIAAAILAYVGIISFVTGLGWLVMQIM